MPYIKADDGRRQALRNGEPALSAGELNYQCFYFIKHSPEICLIKPIESTIRGFVEQFLGAKPNYQKYNDMTGALIRCDKEVYRRLDVDLERMFKRIMESYDEQIATYEDEKIISNGDVE
jgi:hypothetical protein